MRTLALSFAALAVLAVIAVIMPGANEEPAVAVSKQPPAFVTTDGFSDAVYGRQRGAGSSEPHLRARPHLPAQPVAEGHEAAAGTPATPASIWAAPAEFAPPER